MISIITCTMRDHYMEAVFKNYNSQVWEEKELIIVLNKDSMDISKWRKRAQDFPNVSVFQLPEEVTPGECQNYAICRSKYDIIAKFDDDDFYSKYYILEQMKAFKEKNADIVGKRDIYYYLEGDKKLVKTKFNMQNQFVDRVIDSSLMFRKDILDSIKFSKDNLSYDSHFQKECYQKGLKIYSTSRANYTVVRRKDLQSHTWKITDKSIKRMYNVIGEVADFKKYVTKPV